MRARTSVPLVSGVCGCVFLAPIARAGIVFPLASESGLSAEAEFSRLDRNTLEVRLRNTTTGVPEGFGNDDQILTGVSWDFGEPGWNEGDSRIIGGTVVIGSESHTLEFDTGEYGPGTNVGGEYGFSNLGSLTDLLQNFVSCSQALAWPFGGENLDGPVELDGPQGGLVADPVIVPLDGIGAIQDEIVITLNISQSFDDLEFLFDHGVRVEFGAGAAFITSRGGFRYEPPEEVAQLDEPTAVAAGDFGGEAARGQSSGSRDLVVTVVADVEGEPGTVVVLLNDGSGTSYEPVATTVGVDPSDFVVGDFDGVNGPDVAVTNGGDDTVTILLNDGLGEGTFQPPSTVAVGGKPVAIAAGDLDGDTFLDLAVANEADDSVTVLFNDGVGGFGGESVVAIPVGDAPSDLSLDPIDADGFLDMAVINRGDDTFQLFVNDGEGTLVFESEFEMARGPGGIDPGDIDGDKDIDYLTINEDAGLYTVLQNDGDGGFEQSAFAIGETPSSVRLEDLDNDGDLDGLIVAGIPSGAGPGGGTRVIRALRNGLNETGEFSFEPVTVLAPDENLTLVWTSQLNGDSIADVIAVDAETGGAPPGSIEVLLGVGGCVGDVDRDGDVGMADLMDLLAGWGACEEPCPPTCRADLDGDCVVGVEDLLEQLSMWGPCS